MNAIREYFFDSDIIHTYINIDGKGNQALISYNPLTKEIFGHIYTIYPQPLRYKYIEGKLVFVISSPSEAKQRRILQKIKMLLLDIERATTRHEGNIYRHLKKYLQK